MSDLEATEKANFDGQAAEFFDTMGYTTLKINRFARRLCA